MLEAMKDESKTIHPQLKQCTLPVLDSLLYRSYVYASVQL